MNCSAFRPSIVVFACILLPQQQSKRPFSLFAPGPLASLLRYCLHPIFSLSIAHLLYTLVYFKKCGLGHAPCFSFIACQKACLLLAFPCRAPGRAYFKAPLMEHSQSTTPHCFFLGCRPLFATSRFFCHIFFFKFHAPRACCMSTGNGPTSSKQSFSCFYAE